MYRSLLLGSCALLSTLVLGCGSLASNTDEHQPLAVLQGELTNPESVATASSVRVAVVWNCGLEDAMYRVTQEVDVQPVFPSKFRLELTEPPPADCMIDPFAEHADSEPPNVPSEDTPQTPPSEGSPEPEPAPAERSVALTPQDTASPAGLRLGLGTIAAYEDLNGNGVLDLVDPGAPDYVDRVLGANDHLLLVYVENSSGAMWEELRDSNGNLPSPGYNLLEFAEPVAIAPDSGDVAVMCAHPSSGGDGTDDGGVVDENPEEEPVDEPVPMPEGPEEEEVQGPVMQWMAPDTFFVLTMTADPQFASMMCRDGGGLTSESSGGAPVAGAPIEVPPSYPQPGDPGLSCSADGLSYYYESCIDQGVCRGKLCTAQCWYVPDPENPPAGWPCTIP